MPYSPDCKDHGAARSAISVTAVRANEFPRVVSQADALPWSLLSVTSVASKVCNRDAGDGLVASAGRWRGPHPASFVKSAATVQARGQGGSLRGRQNDGGRAGFIGRKQQQWCDRDQFTPGSKLTSMFLQHSHVSPPL